MDEDMKNFSRVMSVMSVMVAGLVFFSWAQAKPRQVDDVLEESGDEQVISQCLKSWGEHPFGKQPKFKTMSSSVKIIGIGKDMVDDVETQQPALVLVKPSVSILSKTAIRLLNPNGWYCLKGRTAVLGKSSIEANCQAKLASSRDGVAILGSSDRGGGVAVLGSAQISRLRCVD